MRIKKLSLWSAVAVLSLVASLACEKRVHAQVTETLVLGSGYNSNFGYLLNGVSYGGGGPIGPSTLNGQSLSYVYCIDIPDEVGVGATYTQNTVTLNGTAVYGHAAQGNTWANGTNLVSVPNAGAVAFLLANYAAGATTTLQQDGLQAAIWTEIYGAGGTPTTGFYIDPTSATGIQMATYLTGVGTAAVSGFVWLSPNGVCNQPIDQALVGNNPNSQSIVPEPSTFAIAGLGALGFMAYGWKRRKRS